MPSSTSIRFCALGNRAARAADGVVRMRCTGASGNQERLFAQSTSYLAYSDMRPLVAQNQAATVPEPRRAPHRPQAMSHRKHPAVLLEHHIP